MAQQTSENNEQGKSIDWAEQGTTNTGYFEGYDMYAVYADDRDYAGLAQKMEDAYDSSVPSAYKSQFRQWANQQGVMKIVPHQQKQRFSYSNIAYIAEGLDAPVPQIVPIANVSYIPHQISFNFFDSSEGKIGVSNPVEKCASLEIDIYVSELVYFWWNHGYKKDKVQTYTQTTHVDGHGTKVDTGAEMIVGEELHSNWKGLNYLSSREGAINSLGHDWDAHDLDKVNFLNFEDTTDFMDFRSSFLTQYSGWVCRFVSHAFPTFYGVITDVKYDISEGETWAKYHVKIEEAVFTLDYNAAGKTTDTSTTTSGGSTTNSGDATNDQTQ